MALVSSSVILTAVACGSEETPSDTTPDASASSPDGASSDASKPVADSGTTTDTGTKTDASDAAADADAEAATPTNDSVWLASSGVLPTASCTPWTLVDTAPNDDPVLSASHVTLASDADAENLYYTQAAADLITPATLVLEARMRLVSGTSSAASRAPAAIIARYGNPLRTVAFFISATDVFLNTADGTKGDSETIATTDAPHTYRIEVNTTTHAIDVKRDSVSILTGAAYVELDMGATAVISWGEISVLATGTSEWVSFTHNAHALKACP